MAARRHLGRAEQVHAASAASVAHDPGAAVGRASHLPCATRVLDDRVVPALDLGLLGSRGLLEL